MDICSLRSVAALHLLLGVVGLALGLGMIVGRNRLPLRPGRNAAVIGPTGWTAFGAFMILLAVPQVAFALLG